MRSHFGLDIGIFCILLPMTGSFAEQTVSFRSILEQYQDKNPRLKSLIHRAASKIRAAEAESGLAPLEIDLESRDLGLDELDLTIGQSFELGGQRQKRATTRRKEALVAEAELELENRKAEELLGGLFLGVVALQEKEKVLDSTMILQEKAMQWIEKAIQIGVLPKIDLMRMELEKKQLVLRKERFHRQKQGILQQINTLAGTQLTAAQKLLLSMDKLPLLQTETQVVELSPAGKISQARVLVAQAELDESRLPWLSELRLEGGYSRTNDLPQNIALLNVGVSIPLFSNTKSRVLSADEALNAEKEAADAVAMEVENASVEIVQNIQLTIAELLFLKEQILPQSHLILQEMYANMERGIFSFLDFQNARKDFLSFEERRLDLLQELGKSWLELNLYTQEKNNVLD